MHLGLPFLSLAITMGAHACDPSSALDEANAKPSQWMGNRTQKIVWAKDLPSSSLTYLLCFLMFLFAHSTSQRGFILGIVFTLVYKFTCSIHFEANPSIATVSNMRKWLQTRELWIAMLDDWRVETHVNSTQMVIDVCKLVGPSKICPLKGRCTHTHTHHHVTSSGCQSPSQTSKAQWVGIVPPVNKTRCEPGILSQHKCLVDRRLVDITMPGESWHKPSRKFRYDLGKKKHKGSWNGLL